MAFTATQIGKEVVGRDRVVTTDLDITSYATGGEAPTLAQLGVNRLIDLEVRGPVTTTRWRAQWDGSLTAPKIIVSGQEPTNATVGVIVFSEVAAATNVGKVRVVARGR